MSIENESPQKRNGSRPTLGRYQNPPELKSLQSLSLEKIVENIHSIPLLGVPPEIMNIITMKAIEKGTLDDYKDDKILVDVHTLLSCNPSATTWLNLKTARFLVKEQVFSAFSSSYVAYLNLDDCMIGDFNPVLNILFKDFHHLKDLRIRNNGLSDISMELLIHHVQNGKGCSLLTQLDLRKNRDISINMMKKIIKAIPNITMVSESEDDGEEKFLSVGQVLADRWIKCKEEQSVSNNFMTSFKRRFNI